MLFINNGGPVKIRIGEASDCNWATIRNGEKIDLTPREGRAHGFSEIKTTEGRIGNSIVQTKQIEEGKLSFFKKLCSIRGIGKKTAKDIVAWGTKEKLIEVIAAGGSLPFRDDIEKLLVEEYA